MRRCLKIAKNGLGSARPNPMVGAVIVANNTIIGEGFTSAYGGPHAEVNAFNSVRDIKALKNATLYVTLEPCSHYGKTPPCTDLIIKNGLPNVVIGCTDDNPLVAGKGIKRLRAAGCNVKLGVLEEDCRKLHKRFFTFINKKRPYVILKWAESKDGLIAPKNKSHKRPVWLSNRYSRQLVHKWRSEEQAILVGTNTVLEDNPKLNVRTWKGEDPMAIVLDKSLHLDQSFHIFKPDGKTLLIHDKSTKPDKKFSLRKGVSFDSMQKHFGIDWNDKNNIAKQVCEVLHKEHINSVIIEGGRKTLQAFLDENLWDEARVFKGGVNLIEGTKAPKLEGELISNTEIIDDTLEIYEPN